MAIDRIPGVGPQNSDIAAAVAAPSAATIAAAVAAPSSATIASAVAAAVPTRAQIQTDITNLGNTYNGPSAATIASTTAASVPTLAQINTAVATNAPSPNNWVFLGSGNLTSVTTATVSFSAYRKIRIVFNASTRENAAETQQLGVRLNGDSGDNYTISTVSKQPGSTTAYYSLPYVRITNRFFISKDTGNARYDSAVIGWMEIDNAATTTAKFMTGDIYYRDASAANYHMNMTGMYYGGSAITSVTFFSGNGVIFGVSGNTTGFQVWGMN